MATISANVPPGPRLLGDGFLRDLRSDLPGVLRRAAQEYGDVVRFPFPGREVFLLSHPDDIRDVLVVQQQHFGKTSGPQDPRDTLLGNGLVRSDGAFHRRQRRLVQPAFHRQRIATYAATMTQYARDMDVAWQDGQALDMAAEMMRLTLRIVGQTLFGADVEATAPEVSAALTIAMHFTSVRTRAFGPISALLDMVQIKKRRERRAAIAQLDAILARIIADRRAEGGDRGDLLSMLLQARDTEGDGTGMSDQQLRDEAMTLFLAGHETTANALSWTWYLLAQHPEVEARLVAELQAVLDDRAAGIDDISNLRYTTQVLSESMRCYPPVWTIARQNHEPYAVRGYTLPAGSLVLLSQWVVHHDPRWYPDPMRFDPDRWTETASAARPKYAYFPFGGGPRLCIGEPFAWMEATIVLATLARHWHAALPPSTQVGTEALITLRPRGGIPVTLHHR